MSTAIMTTSILLALEKKIPEAEGKGIQLRIHRLINWLLRGETLTEPSISKQNSQKKMRGGTVITWHHWVQILCMRQISFCYYYNFILLF